MQNWVDNMSTEALLGRGLDGGTSVDAGHCLGAGPSASDSERSKSGFLEDRGKGVLSDVFADRQPWAALIFPKHPDGEDSLIGDSPRCAAYNKMRFLESETTTWPFSCDGWQAGRFRQRCQWRRALGTTRSLFCPWRMHTAQSSSRYLTASFWPACSAYVPLCFCLLQLPAMLS